MFDKNVIGAFSEEHAERLSGVSRAQLRRWDRIGLLQPSFGSHNRGAAFSRIYSFRDIVSLRVLNELRRRHGVSLKHLREVKDRLSHLGDDLWAATKLYVLGKKVVWDDPRTDAKEEVVGGQQVFDVPLQVAIGDTRQAMRDMNRRTPDELGRIIQRRSIMQNQPVFAHTRIPVAAVRNYLAVGADAAAILKEYPELSVEDIEAARSYAGLRAA